MIYNTGIKKHLYTFWQQLKILKLVESMVVKIVM